MIASTLAAGSPTSLPRRSCAAVGYAACQDDADRDLAFTLGQRVAARLKMRAERADEFCEFWIVDPDLHRARQASARLHDGVVGILLFGRHPIGRDFRVASEGRSFRCHFLLPGSRCSAERQIDIIARDHAGAPAVLGRKPLHDPQPCRALARTIRRDLTQRPRAGSHRT